MFCKANYVRENIRTPHNHDVLCGRGGGTNNHIGNEKFRDLVNQKKRDYLNSSKREKPLVSKSIVDEIRNMSPPGRFLQKNEATNLWFDIGDQKAREKTSQALREGAPEIRKELGVDGNKNKMEIRGSLVNMVGAASSTNRNGLLVGMRNPQMQWSDIHGLPLGRPGQPLTREIAVLPNMVENVPLDLDHAPMRRMIPPGGSMNAYLSSQHVHQQHGIRLNDSKAYQGRNRLENSGGGPPWSPSSHGQSFSAHHQQQYPIQVKSCHKLAISELYKFKINFCYSNLSILFGPLYIPDSTRSWSLIHNAYQCFK